MDKIKRIKKSLGLATALFVSVPFGIGVAFAGPGVRADQKTSPGVRFSTPGRRVSKDPGKRLGKTPGERVGKTPGKRIGKDIRREKAVKKVLKREMAPIRRESK